MVVVGCDMADIGGLRMEAEVEAIGIGVGDSGDIPIWSAKNRHFFIQVTLQDELEESYVVTFPELHTPNTKKHNKLPICNECEYFQWDYSFRSLIRC